MPRISPASLPQDRTFFLVMVVIAWISIITGFTNGLIGLSRSDGFNFSFAAYIHIVIFLGWMLLFTTQIVLIRQKNIKFHRKLGKVGAVLAIAIVISGVVTSLASESRKFGTSSSDPAFLSLLFADLLAFIGPTIAAIIYRNSPADHKRLILVGTIALLDAGFARFLSPLLVNLIGDNYWMYTNLWEGFWPFFFHHIFFCLLMILAIGFYDIITRRKLITSYVYAVIWYLIIMLSSAWLYFSPRWLEISKMLIGQ